MKRTARLAGWLILVCLLAATAPGGISPGGIAPGGIAQGGEFAAFRAARMRLPVCSEPVTLVAVGDVMLSRGVAGRIQENGNLGLPFAKVTSLLRTGDIVFGNLENPLTPGREINIREMVLRADPGMADALADAGFTVLSLANNHTPDFGATGILDTLRNLDQAGIAWVGAGSDASEAYASRMVEVKGLRFAFLAFTDPGITPPLYEASESSPGTASADIAKMQAAIKDARLDADFVVVSLHAGVEYEAEPDDLQVELAHAAIDAGADLVIGHHPHVVQPVERYRDRYILYSLGNFVFDQWWSEETCQGLIARLVISAAGVERVEFYPVTINRDAQPEISTGPEASAILSRLKVDLDELGIGPLDGPVGTDSARFGYLDLGTGDASGSRLLNEQFADLDRDGVVERFTLRDGRLAIAATNGTIWETPETWWVDNFTLGDANNDGINDLNLIVWKSGSFGRDRPFWVTEDDPSVKNHLSILDLVSGAIKPAWQSSNLDCPNYSVELADLDGDGQNELLAVEGDYDDPGIRRITVWKWNDWGFYKVCEQFGWDEGVQAGS
ncbi:MAG: CapA family protein [Bacillota bacterium]